MDTFNPVKYSTEENKFLLENAGLPPVVALNQAMPEGVNPKAIRPVLQEVYDRMQLSAASEVTWVGVDAIKTAIRTYLEIDGKWAKDHLTSRGKIPRTPSMYTKDAKGRYHISGPGSDSNFPRTYEGKDKKRYRFEIWLSGDDPDVEEDIKACPDGIIEEADKNRWVCPICSHTESYKEDSRSSRNSARARMSKHLKTAQVEADLHRELHTVEFGS